MPKRGRPPNTSPTPDQLRFVGFLRTFIAKHGYSPSQREIARHLGFKSVGTVNTYVQALTAKGVLKNSPNAYRGLALADSQETSPSIALPRLGFVAAGKPIEAITTQETLDVPSSMVNRGEHFVLTVMGSSMIDDGIFHGDYLVVRKQRSAENGQTVVALIGNEATVKRFYRKAGQVELRPANPAFRPILVDRDESFQIEGIVTGVIRRLDQGG